MQKAFVKAQVISGSEITELVQGTDYSVSDRELTLTTPVSSGLLLKIYRETTTATIVTWNDASVLRAKDMSLQEVQLLHLAEETADNVFDSGMSTAPTNTNVWDGQYKRITNLLDPQTDGDAVTLRYVKANQSSLITAIKSEGATQVNSVKSTGTAQVNSVNSTGNTQNTRLTTTGDTQNKRVTDTGNSYVATMTTLKDTATTQANNATTQANLAKAWAMSDSSPDGVSGNKSSKSWANDSKTYASNAKTSETNATTQANNAKASASTATTQASTATTQATNASNSAKAAANSASTATTQATNASNSAKAAANSATAAANSASVAAKFDPSSYYAKTEITNLFSQFAQSLYPVGSYIYSDKSNNPATYLPYMSGTTWVQTAQGRVLIGAGNADSGTTYTAGKTGGEEKHTNTIAEIPSHDHRISTASLIGKFSALYAANSSYSGGYGIVGKEGNYDGHRKGSDGNSNDGSNYVINASHSHTISNTGGGQAHNNMQPYSVVYIWKRTG